MRRLMLMAALAAATTLAACTLRTPEGAACNQIGGVDQCPEGQRCGADGKCSVAAVACEGLICTASTCSGAENKTLNRCEQAGVCASLGSDVLCSQHQDCDAGAGACVCRASACGAATVSLCNAGGELVACSQDPGTNCPYEEPPVGCGAHKECQESGASAACVCLVDLECPSVGPNCLDGNTRLVTCREAQTCVYKETEERCDPGESCESGACVCPSSVALPVADGACETVDDLACDGTSLLKCRPVAVGSPCSAWQVERPCGSDSLACAVSAPGVAACVCPPFVASPRTLMVDRNAPGEVGIERNGADSPICRYTSLKIALDAALEGDTVKASGAAPTMEFTEGPLTVKRGVTLTTSDAVPAPANYVILPADGVGASALVTLQPAATISGFELRNKSATGSAIASSCSGPTDTAADTVTVASVAIAGLGTVTPTARFQHGVSHGGKCSLVLRDSVIEGAADSGLYVNATAPVALTLTNNTIQLNAATERFTIDGSQRTGGGIVLKGQTPQSVSFRQNRVLGNVGDQVLVFVAGDVNLSGNTSGVCDADSNVIACYATGVGIASAASRVDASYSTWWHDAVSLVQGQDYVVNPGSSVDGTGTACPKYSGTCPTGP